MSEVRVGEVEGVFSWSTFYAHRKRLRERFPSVYALPIRKKLFDVIIDELGGGESILDVGASSKSLGERIGKVFSGVTYKTMDIDRAGEHDYYSLDDIGESFDVIVLSEVIEHLEFTDGMELLGRLRGLLKEGGRIIVSTPNLNHPNRYWKDPDHRTPYMYESLGGALLQSGYDVRALYRIYNDQFLRRFIRLYLMAWLHRYLDVDFAKSIVAVGRRK